MYLCHPSRKTSGKPIDVDCRRSSLLCAGLGLASILPAVIERIPPPPGNTAGPLRVLLFDAFHDEYRGVICLVEIVDGHLRKGDKVVASSTGDTYDILEVSMLFMYLTLFALLCS